MNAPTMEPASEHALFPGGGEMGDLVRAKDWSATPFGPLDGWPQSLKTATALMLESSFAMVVAWGADFRFLYNDRYRPILGNKHPHALGAAAKDIFPEVWANLIEPLFQRTRRGEAVAIDDLYIPLHRHGYLESCYFTIAYSPIRDESGGVGGMLAVVAETTERIEGERRLSTLRDLARRATDAKTPADACVNAAAILAENQIDVPFALLYLIDDAGVARRVATAGLAAGTATPETIEAQAPAGSAVHGANGTGNGSGANGGSARGWPIDEALRAGKAVVLDDVAARFGPLHGGPYPEPVHTAVILPLSRPGMPPFGILIVGVSARRALNEHYRDFLDLAAEHITTAIANARAFEEQRRRADALAEIDRAKTAFFSNVSHEFRTPLTLMLGPLEDVLARPGSLPLAEVRDQLEVTQRNSLRLLKLVNSLLDFSRIEAGRVTASYEPVDLAAFTAELTSVFRAAIEKAQLTCRVECPPLTEPAFVDRDMWEKIVFNLLSNALKFTLAGEIAVALRQTEKDFTLTVADTGIGIPEEELPNLFKRFHRIENVRSRTHEGTGIGLALVQELVKLHGGSVTAASRAGQGSTFTVTIPRGKAHLPPDQLQPLTGPDGRPRFAPTRIRSDSFLEEALRWLPTDEPAPTANPAGGSRETPALGAAAPPPARVVVVDDNADMRDYARRLLGAAYAIDCFPDGEAALAAIRRQRPDLILSDVMMPRLDGFGLLRAVRADPHLQSIPVILLSARAGNEASVDGYDAGADDYLIKPFTARELQSRVAAHLKMTRLRSEVARQGERVRTHERDAALLAALSQDLAAFSTDAEIIRHATRVVGEHLRVDRCYFAESDPTGHRLIVDQAWSSGDAPSLKGSYALDEYGTREWRQAFVTEWLRIDDVTTHPLTRGFAAEYEKILIGAYATVPFSREGKWLVSLAVTESKKRSWKDEDLVFLENVAARVWPMVERARAAATIVNRNRLLEVLNSAAVALSHERDLEKIVQHVTDTAREVSGAAFGAFFYNVTNDQGESYTLYTISGVPREAFAKFPMPRNTALFGPTFRGEGVIRIGDVHADPRFAQNSPHHGMPQGHLPVVSYLAVPVKSRSGEVLGGLFFGHPAADVFTAEAETIVAALAGQAAIAIDNANLYRGLQRELLRSKEGAANSRRLASIVASSDDAIISKDLNGIINSWNAGAERLFGYTSEEIVGKSVLTLIPRDRHHEEPVILARLRQGEHIDHFETVRMHKNGSLLGISLSVSPLRDDHGQVIGASSIARDVTARRRADEQQRALYEMLVTVNRAGDLPEIYEAALNATLRCLNLERAAILVYNEAKVMRFVAWRGLSDPYRAAVEGHSPWKPEERDPRPVCIEDIAGASLEPRLREVVEREGVRALAFIPLSYEKRLRGKLMLYYDRPYQVKPAELQVAEAIASQIAFALERQRSAHELETQVAERTQSLSKAIAQMEEFSYSVSHDLRSPVRAMRGYAEVVLSEYGDRLDDEGRELLARIQRNGTRMDRLIQDLLTYSRITRRAIHFEPVSLEKLIHEVVQQYPEMRPNRAQIDIPESIPAVLAHEPSLTQVVSNLLSNAVKFVAPGVKPHIQIGFRRADGRVRLWFSDNGIGVPPEYHSRLFGMFERVHDNKQYEGTGIGLAIVRKAMERMNGRVGVLSDGTAGSRFWIELDEAPPK